MPTPPPPVLRSTAGLAQEFNQLVKKILEEPDLQKVQHDPQFAREKVADQTASARDQLHQLLKGVFDEEEEALLHEPATRIAPVQRPRPKDKGPPRKSPTPAPAPAPAGAASGSAAAPGTGPEAVGSIPDFDKSLVTLMGMGFSQEECTQALVACNGNLEEASELLVQMT